MKSLKFEIWNQTWNKSWIKTKKQFGDSNITLTFIQNRVRSNDLDNAISRVKDIIYACVLNMR